MFNSSLKTLPTSFGTFTPLCPDPVTHPVTCFQIWWWLLCLHCRCSRRCSRWRSRWRSCWRSCWRSWNRFTRRGRFLCRSCLQSFWWFSGRDSISGITVLYILVIINCGKISFSNSWVHGRFCIFRCGSRQSRWFYYCVVIFPSTFEYSCRYFQIIVIRILNQELTDGWGA